MKTFDFDGEQLFKAIAKAVPDIAFDSENGVCPKPGSDCWNVSSIYRRELFERVRRVYCKELRCEEYTFPFSEDGVCLAYIRFRKDQGSGGTSSADAEERPLFD